MSLEEEREREKDVLKIQQEREKDVLKIQQQREGGIQNQARERRRYSKSSNNSRAPPLPLLPSFVRCESYGKITALSCWILSKSFLSLCCWILNNAALSVAGF